jgi:hypothetical protein
MGGKSLLDIEHLVQGTEIQIIKRGVRVVKGKLGI